MKIRTQTAGKVVTANHDDTDRQIDRTVRCDATHCILQGNMNRVRVCVCVCERGHIQGVTPKVVGGFEVMSSGALRGGFEASRDGERTLPRNNNSGKEKCGSLVPLLSLLLVLFFAILATVVVIMLIMII